MKRGQRRSRGEWAEIVDDDCDGQTDENALPTELCNGIDDDCDGSTDEGLLPADAPPGTCDGDCPAGSATAWCDGTNGWKCTYSCYGDGGDVECSAGVPSGPETRCDGIDNDCDGQTDEDFTDFGTTCTLSCITGIERCLPNMTDTICCDLNKQSSGTSCTSGNELTSIPTDESEPPNGVDDDCDGETDEELDNCVDYITVNGGAGDYDVMVYEASRYNSSSSDPGSFSTIPCSLTDRVPWTNVSYSEADGACDLLNDVALDCVSNPEQCWKVCSAEQWQYVCEEGGGVTTLYPYAADYAPQSCNGLDHTSVGIMATGSLGTCRAEWGTTDVYDLSGNIEEWTSTEQAANQFQIRGGSYNDLGPPSISEESGLACTFDFWSAQDTFRMPNLGFRCCRGYEPLAAIPDTCAEQIAVLPTYSFETSPQGWYLNDDWERGVDAWAGALDGTSVLGTRLNTNARIDSYLHSPVWDLSQCTVSDTVSLRFGLNYNVSEADDGDWVTYAIWDGTQWGTLAPVDAAHAFDNGVRWRRQSDESGWWDVQIDVSNYTNADFQVRFYFNDDGDGNRDDGMFIDNVRITSP